MSYLLNLDIFYHYTMNNVLGTLRGQVRQAAPMGGTLFGDYSREGMLATYTRPEIVPEPVPPDRYLEKAALNLEHNILPLLEENPETEFVFFMVPFSMAYWDDQVRRGIFDATMTGVEYALDRLLAYDNVTVYYYQDMWDVATDLDNYKDYSHYGGWINSRLTQSMAAGEGELTRDNYLQVLRDMKEYVYAYDFDALLS